MLLALDTSSLTMSLALVGPDGRVLEHVVEGPPQRQSVLLPGAIEALLERHGVALSQLDGFVVGLGPGSFTGLRIGLSTIKGLAYALEKPVVGVSSLAALALEGPADTELFAAATVKRGELYLGRYRHQRLDALGLSGGPTATSGGGGAPELEAHAAPRSPRAESSALVPEVAHPSRSPPADSRGVTSVAPEVAHAAPGSPPAESSGLTALAPEVAHATPRSPREGRPEQRMAEAHSVQGERSRGPMSDPSTPLGANGAFRSTLRAESWGLTALAPETSLTVPQFAAALLASPGARMVGPGVRDAREALLALGVPPEQLLEEPSFPSAVALARLATLPAHYKKEDLFALEPHYLRGSGAEENPKFPPLPGVEPRARLKED